MKEKYIQDNEELQNDRVNTKSGKENLRVQFAELHSKQCWQKGMNLIGDLNQDTLRSHKMK
jgi:hypothetical protein